MCMVCVVCGDDLDVDGEFVFCECGYVFCEVCFDVYVKMESEKDVVVLMMCDGEV